MMVRNYQNEAPPPTREGQSANRLNLLLSYGGWNDSSAVVQLACLLEPLGIRSITAESGEQAAAIISAEPIHIAIVDLAIPLAPGAGPSGAQAGGGRILQLLRRLDPAPPTVVVRPPQPAVRESVRGLAEALREGAFAVVDRPVRLETMLEVMRRIVLRHYAGHWPDTAVRERPSPPTRPDSTGDTTSEPRRPT